MLRIHTTSQEGCLSPAAIEALTGAAATRSAVYLAASSFEQGLQMQKELATRGLSLGVETCTLATLSQDLWRLWGDGTTCVDPVTRRILARRAMRSVPAGLLGKMQDNPGTIDVVAKLASRALPWLPLDEEGDPQEALCSAAGLSESEVAALRVAGAYRKLLHKAGYLESSEILERVPRALPEKVREGAALVVCDHVSLTRAQREFIVGMAAFAQVDVCAQVPEGPAGELARNSLAWLRADSKRAGVEVAVEEEDTLGSTVEAVAPADVPARAPEIQGLLDALFDPRSTLASTGAVELLQPAGPVAEPELVARKAWDLAQAGAHRVTVAVADTQAAWQDLAPKLAARGLTVKARLRRDVSEIYAGRVFIAYLRQVAQLKELAESWPAKEACEEGELVRLGDMGWWPPQALIDFLMHDMARLKKGRAYDIDKAWRGNRLLTPAAVLDELMSPKKTSNACAKAMAELMLGRVGSCASKLMDAYRVKPGAPAADKPADELCRQEATGVLQAAMMVAGALAQLGVTAAPLADNAIALSSLVEQVVDELEHISLVLTPSLPAAGLGETDEDGAAANGPCEVVICSLADAARLSRLGTDALIYCSQTATESPIGRSDDVLSRVLEATGVEPACDRLALSRSNFWHALCSPRENLVLERCIFDADSAPTFPSVMLCEALAAYGVAASAKPLDITAVPHAERDEALLAENLLDPGQTATAQQVDNPSAAGAIDDAARPLILVPGAGQAKLPGSLPMLSASQIESYLECPYKWFSLRRLSLDNVDAGFTGTEMGTFVHRVLELAHARLLAEGLDRMANEDQVIDLDAHPEIRVPGSRVTADNVEDAKAIVAEEFDNHLRHQFLERKRVSKMDQLLVPHAIYEEQDIDQARADLLSLMDYEAGVLVGYEPRWLEWGFGGPNEEPVTYAGVLLNGKIDRMDVDDQGRALIIDYKHKSPNGFNQYDAFKGDFDAGVLPRHVQSLIYAQVVRRTHPNIRLEGALFLSTKGNHALAGACAESQVERVLGTEDVTLSRRESMGIVGPGGGTEEFWEYLDDVEAMVAEKIGELLAGKIDARPIDADACSYCPHLHCEKRMGA